ncbi:MAG TPA: alkaline phosphatase family protein [Candidatus Kapabacteria bacterium]|nr:alkaline phosphatase family protein [Candidatus Kapabacteria bacterium]
MSGKPDLSVLFIFVDGVGLGNENDANPFFSARIPVLKKLLNGAPSLNDPVIKNSDAMLLPLNATLGIAGLPQSGTGQATLMTGVNCPQLNGAHFGPYPPALAREVLKEKNIFRVCQDELLAIDFVNGYPQRYFDYLDERPLMRPAIASSFLSTGRALHRVEEIKDGIALSADITGERWYQFGFNDVPALTPHEAGKRLVAIAGAHAFTMFEYFATDKAGHKQDMKEACIALERLDGMLGGVLEDFDHEHMLLVLTSDHGNMEDLSANTHTLNPVPLLVIGNARDAFSGARALTDVAPPIISLLTS